MIEQKGPTLINGRCPCVPYILVPQHCSAYDLLAVWLLEMSAHRLDSASAATGTAYSGQPIPNGAADLRACSFIMTLFLPARRLTFFPMTPPCSEPATQYLTSVITIHVPIDKPSNWNLPWASQTEGVP